MKIPKKVVETVHVKSVRVHAKVCDSASYSLIGANDLVIAERDGYVPNFFPEEHYGDYLDLEIDIETGMILNWTKPDPEEVAKAFGLLET